MVFESYVVDLVNKFGGQFLENLDPSQLKLGIWGGDAKLENLILKESALDDFDLPVKVVRGHLGKLVLKIPWKNLYSEPVVAKIDGLYLLVRPNTGIKYNAEKEEKAEKEKKKRQLEAIEVARKLEEEKKKASGKEKKDKKEDDGFVEKLAMQVVKNLQIYISNIHVRYEDAVSNPSAPFSIGVTLENLSAQTTDENWLPSIADQSIRIVNKLVELNSLALYWNTNDVIGKLPSQSDWVNVASGGIAKTIQGNYKPKDYKYILQPISATSKLKLDTKPGSDLSSPKVYLGLVLEEIFLNLSKRQYHNIMELLDSFDYMSRNTPYRKYKPLEALHGHAGKWWKYAMNSVLEEDVRRQNKNWSWEHMKAHRNTCKQYKALYKIKLLQDKLSKEEQKNLENLEEKLDVLNITICRQRAEFEEAAALRKKKRKAEEKSKEGFFSGWFGSSKKKKEKSEEPEILTEDQKKEELQKLYAAIGYSENEVITAFPKDYVENKVIIHLKQIGFALRDVDPISDKVCDIVKLRIQDLYADLAQRPSAQAIKVTAKIDQMKMFGATSESKYLPLMITSQHGKEESAIALFNAAFETNPLDEKCDQRLTAKSQPLKIVYDAFTVDKVIDFFKPPKGVQLQELSAVALSRIEELKTASKASLAYAVEHHKVTDINVDVMSPYIIIPEKGRYEGSTSLLVVDLGHLKITSDPEQERIVSTKELSLTELESKCYDKFDIRLEALQVLIAKKDDAWDAARSTKMSKLHVIDPVELDLKLEKALNPDDIRLAQIKLSGSLHSINLHVTDKKLEQVMKLALSIPIPGAEVPVDVTDAPPSEQILDKGQRIAAIRTLSPGLLESSPGDIEDEEEAYLTPPEESEDETARLDARKTMARQVKVAVRFEIEKVCVSAGFEDAEGNETPCMAVSLEHLGTVIQLHPYDLNVNASIGSLAVKEMSCGLNGEPVYLIQTPQDAALLSIKYIKADQESPEYYTTFMATEQHIEVDFTSLDVLLHQEALLRLMDFSGKLIPALEENQESIKEKGKDIKGEITKHKSKSDIEVHKKSKRKARSDPNNILVDLKAKMGGISVMVTSAKGDIASILIGGLSAHVTVLDDRTNVTALMKDLSVMDTTPGVLYPNIVSIVNQEVFNVEVVAYKDAMENGNYTNMEIVDTSFKMAIGCIRVIFLNKFVMELLAFLNNFQKAKEAMQQATKTATEKAATKMQDLQAQTARVKLQVSIQAPLIIIPVSSSSHDALVADLGLLNVSNSFSIHKPATKPCGSDAVIVDKMVVELSSVKLSRGSMSGEGKLETGAVIIEPISMAIYLSRNLSPWCHDIPDIDVHGKLKAVELCTGEQDIATILAVVFQNLAEGPQKEDEEESDEEIEEEIVPLTEASLEGAPDEKPTKAEVWDTVKFAFEIEEVSASVFYKEAKESGSTRDPACCLGKFSLVSVKTSGRMTSNMALDAVVALETCILDDKRPESVEGITRMMDRFYGESRNLPNMVDVKFNQSPKQDKNIAIEVNNVHIVANLEFILVLANVFTSALAAAPPKPVIEPNVPDMSKAVAKVQATVIQSAIDYEAPDMRLQFALRQPEIVLLADAKDKATHALFLKNNIDFNMVSSQGQEKMFGHLSNLSITSASFDLEHRDATKTQVFYLSQLALHSSAPEGQNMHIDIRTTVAHIHVSPPTIRTITACLMSLTPAKDSNDENAQQSSDSTFWTENQIDKKDKWYLTPVQHDQIVPGVRIYGRWPKNDKYYPGYVSKIDSRVHLKFDDGDETSHDIQDLASVVLDQVPKKTKLKVGTKVLAPDQKVTRYLSTAKIKKIEKKDNELVYHVCYEDGNNGSFDVTKLRKLTLIKPGVSDSDIVPSSIVFVRTEEKYSKGFISSKLQRRYVVKSYKGKVINVNIEDTPAIVLDKVPNPSAIHIGMTVIASRKDSEFWYTGKVYQLKKENNKTLFNIVLERNEQVWHDVENIRIVPMKRQDVPEGSIDVGSFVWAWWKAIKYYPGYISYKGNKLHVDFYNGDRRLYDLKEALVNVLPEVTQNVRDVQQGSRVISRYKNNQIRCVGTVVKVDKTKDNFRFYHVKLDDGDEDWVRLFDLQLLPKNVTCSDSGSRLENQGLASQEGADAERGEMMLFNMEGFNIKMEGMFGGQVMPLLSMDGQVQAEIKDWSSKLEVSAGVSVGANYFNEDISEWEPLIEPVEEANQKYRPWELTMEFSLGSENGGNGNDEEVSTGGLDVNAEPAMSLAIESKDDLQVTVTKTGLDVFNKLASAFSEAVTLEESDKIAMEEQSPFVVCNELGLGIKVFLGNSLKGSHTDEEGPTAFSLENGRHLPLYLTQEADRRASRKVRNREETGLNVSIEVQGYHTTKDIPIKQARVAFYTLVPRQLLKGTMMSMVVQVESGEGQKTVTVRSPLQIHNHFPIPLDLSCKRESQVSVIATIPSQSIYNVPLVLAYRAGLLLKPSGFAYNNTSAPLLWTQLKTVTGARYLCSSEIPGEPSFYIQVMCEKAQYTMSQGVMDSSPVYVYHLYPTAILHNYLPYNIHYSTEGIPYVGLIGGENCALYSVDLTQSTPLNIQVDGYLGESWRGEILIKRGMSELSVFVLYPSKSGSSLRPVELGVFTQMDGALNITIYSRYWMVNKTGMFLEYKASDDDHVVAHPDSERDSVMFSYKGKGNVFSKKTTKIRLQGSDWSDKFSLDTVGSGGSMKLKKRDKEVEIGIQISLSYFSLTKIVEFTPFNLLKNQLTSSVHLCEATDKSNPVWTVVDPGACVPFWPSSVPPKNLMIRVGNDDTNSPRFNFQSEVSVLLRMGDKVGAVCVEMVSKESAAIMTFTPYFDGAAPVRIENCSVLEIHYKQDSKESQECVLHPNHSILYTWDKLMDAKTFVWWAKGEEDKQRKTDLKEVCHSSFEVKGSTFYWATFLDGLQRVLLIIDDFTLAYRAQLEIPERISQSIKLDLHGIGLSLVNNEKSIELSYIGITKSDIIWEEMKKKGRWKALKLSLSKQLDEAWNHVQHISSIGGEPNFRKKFGDIEVDFDVMEIIQPHRRRIRRTFTPGVSVEYTASPHELNLHTKVNSIQIDSQIPGSTFRKVLHPVPPPKSVAADNAPKPFFEMSVVMRQVEHSQVNEIKYFMVLIQEMEVMIDMGFIMALVELFSSDTIDRSKELSQYAADKKRVLDSLAEAHAVQAALGDTRNYFDKFHLSPLKIHLSFSQLGGPSDDNNDSKSSTHIGNSFVSLLMQSVGVAVTEVQDVEFKLAYFEIDNKVYNQQQLTNVIAKHYTSQAIKQMYVLVLGLDVLGNPFGLISGLKEGAVDLFYEPYQGLIQGPGEFAEGLALGVRSLFGHTVGGAAGAVSRITGTVGKGIAALTMDEKYQQERRQAMGKKPVNVGEGLARGGKGLLEGVFDGVTGIVTKPVEGAKQQGAAGFFKGVGKGLVGVVAKPAGGIVDFASSTLEGIKGTADNQAEILPLRPPRVFYADKVMKPYNLYEATGNAIFEAVKSHESVLAEDRYFAHRELNIKKTLIITNKHIIVAGKTEVFEAWESDFTCAFADLTAEPTTDKNKVLLSVPDKGRVLFKRAETKAITTPTPQIAQWIVKKIKEARS